MWVKCIAGGGGAKFGAAVMVVMVVAKKRRRRGSALGSVGELAWDYRFSRCCDMCAVCDAMAAPLTIIFFHLPGKEGTVSQGLHEMMGELK
eukprot:11853114-Ditylum_brightwellii.AAC.1